MADDTWCSPWLKPLTHTSGQHTSHSATRSGACHGVHQPCHSYTHTKGRGPWIDGQSGIHNMPPLRERERGREWMVDSGLVSVDKPLATQQGKRRHHSSHAAITQAYTSNHHTITLTTQAWSWSLTACSLTHTRGPRQDKEHTITKPMVWMACTVTMVWHKRGCGVVLPSSLVQHVVAPTPSKWPRAHHTALQPPQHPCFLVSTHVPQPVHTHPTCVCDCGTEPSTMPTSVVINHCVPCQSTTWSFIHHQSPPPPAAAQEQESVVTQMDEGMEAHTTHSVVESNTANQHTSTHTSGHTNTSQPPIHHHTHRVDGKWLDCTHL